jgi:hypothetical protein
LLQPVAVNYLKSNGAARKGGFMKKILIFVSIALLAGLISCAAPHKSAAGELGAETAGEAVADAGDRPQGGGEANPERAAAAASGPLPKVAVYVTGGKTPDENKAFSTRITHALVSSGKYNTIERSDAFLDQVAKEMIAQRSGAIDDNQISELGRQAGADFVCVGEILDAFGASQISARIMNVESVEVIASGLASGPLKTMADFAALSDRVAALLLGVAQNTAPISGAAASANQAAPEAPTAAAAYTAPAQPAETNQAHSEADYRSVKIGDLIWMAENLNIATKDSWCYGDAAFNCAKYGRLYAWSAAVTACPNGWHLPANAEWENLVNATGGKKGCRRKVEIKNGVERQ